MWTSGYRPIVDYLAANSPCHDLDETLTPIERADTAAHAAFLASRAGPLIDLSLYVSAANWAAVTRPAYTAILPWPLTWTLPPLLRADAIKRAEHLGLAELDTDFDPHAGLHITAGRDALPETFRRHLPAVKSAKTVREEMTPEQAAAIRLYGLAEDCLKVVSELMVGGTDGTPRFYASAKPSSLDCLAYGYLALMVAPAVPRSFLRDWIEAETPLLSQFVKVLSPPERHLAVGPPVSNTVLRSVGRVADSLVRNMPTVGEPYSDEMRRRTDEHVSGLDARAWAMLLGVAATGAAAGYGLHMYKSLQPFGAWTQTWRSSRGGSKLNQFGELGSMLNNAMGAFPGLEPARNASSVGTGKLVEVDSDVD